MSEHKAHIHWYPDDQPFLYETYDRDHNWRLESGAQIPASAAVEYNGAANRANPEEALVVAIASCHMLTFLAIAAKKRITVVDYKDNAVGLLAKNAQGRLAITEVTLRPQITFEGGPPSAETMSRLHELSHSECFIANSVHCTITVEGTVASRAKAD